MKKHKSYRTIIMIYLVLVMISIVSPVKAEYWDHIKNMTKFDYSVFQADPQKWTITIDDMDDFGQIIYNGEQPAIYDMFDKLYGYGIFARSNIALYFYGTNLFTPALTLDFLYKKSDWLFINSIIVKVGNNRYTFDHPTVFRETQKAKYNTIAACEYVRVIIDKDSIGIIDGIINDNANMKIRLKGKNNYVDIEMTEEMHKYFKDVFVAYVNACQRPDWFAVEDNNGKLNFTYKTR